MLALLLPAGVALLVALLCWLVGRGDSLYAKGLKQGFAAPPIVPILGNVMDYWGDEVHIFAASRRFTSQLGSRWLVKIMHECSLNIADDEATEAVMTSSKHITKGKLYDLLLPWLGRGLLTNFGSSWHRRRKLLTPAFHFKILDEFGPMLDLHAKNLVKDLLTQSTPSEAVDVVNIVSKITLRSISQTAMGVELDSCGNEEDYFKAVRKVGQSLLYRMSRPWLWNKFFFGLTPYGRETQKALNFLHDFTRKVIRERKASLLSQGHDPSEGTALRKRRLAFLDMLLAAQKEDPSLSDEDIREETDTFMFEGHETTAMAICWTLFALGNHLDIQQRVREEVLQANDWQQVMALPYLEMVIKESLRLYPPVLFIQRVSEHDLKMGKQTVPAGVNLDVHIFTLHRDPKNFPDPLRFDPERFSPEQEQGRHPFAYVPFSGGLRNCIGRRFAMMELKLMVAEVLRSFSFKSLLAEDEITFGPELVLRAKQGIQLYLEPLH